LGHSFPAIDASEVEQLAIAPAQNNLAPAQANELKGAIVLIGPEHYGDDDRHMTPLSQEMSGVEVHANILSTILDGAGIAIWSANQERAAASGMTLLLSLTSLFGSLAKGIGLGRGRFCVRVVPEHAANGFGLNPGTSRSQRVGIGTSRF
jgi:CHASE2 domain-containing sensor protein